MFHKIDDELSDKRPFRIYTQDWKPREQLDFEIEAENVCVPKALKSTWGFDCGTKELLNMRESPTK